MTAHYVVSPKAKSDLREIWRHTSRRWGRGQAATYTKQLHVHMEAIAAQPNMGRACPDVRTGYYQFSSGSHVLFYRLTAEGVEFVRLLHSRMDFERHIP